MSEARITFHERSFHIAWGDMDALGHVNNARYFDYFQEARIEWLRAVDEHLDKPQGPVVIHTDCTFLKPVTYPALVKVCTSIKTLGRTSMVFQHQLFQGHDLMAEGTCKIVWVDYEKNKSIPLPEAIRTFCGLLD